MQSGMSGFQNAPVTRAFILASALLSIVFSVQGRSRLLGLSYPNIVKNFRIWRIVASIFAFSSTPELMFGLYLLYYFRVFERQIGSNKYSVFILFSITVSSVLEILSLMLLKDSNFNVLPSGPYGLIFASFLPFYLDIPVTSRFRIFGLNFSDKSFIYLAGLQLLLSSWKRSLLPGICGLIAGSLYRLNVLGIRRIKVSALYSQQQQPYYATAAAVAEATDELPEFIASFFARFFAPSSASSSRPPSRNVIGNMSSHADRPVQNYASMALAPASEPSDSSVAMLVSMGFDSNAARQALMRARNDINVATDILLEAQSR